LPDGVASDFLLRTGCALISVRVAVRSTLRECRGLVLAARQLAMRSTSLHGEEEHREHRVSLQRHRLPRECVAYIQPCRYDAWLWLPPQDPAAKPPPNRRLLWLPLHCAAARQEASLRFVPRQPNHQKKEQHQE